MAVGDRSWLVVSDGNWVHSKKKGGGSGAEQHENEEIRKTRIGLVGMPQTRKKSQKYCLNHNPTLA